MREGDGRRVVGGVVIVGGLSLSASEGLDGLDTSTKIVLNVNENGRNLLF